MTTTPRERVRAGVAWLDENQPRWRDRVSVNDLEMANGCRCVLGQLFEVEARQASILMPCVPGYVLHHRRSDAGRGIGYNWAVRQGNVMSKQRAVSLGFDIDFDGDFRITFKTLQDLWSLVLKGEDL